MRNLLIISKVVAFLALIAICFIPLALCTRVESSLEMAELKLAVEMEGSKALLEEKTGLERQISLLGAAIGTLEELYLEIVDLEESRQILEEDTSTKERQVVALEQLIEGHKAAIVNLRRTIDPLRQRRTYNVSTLSVACSGSMEPTLSCDDEIDIWIRPDVTEIRIGDIVLYETRCPEWLPDRSLVMHRVVSRMIRGGEHFFILRGDANITDDPCLVKANQIQGYVIEIHEGAGS